MICTDCNTDLPDKAFRLINGVRQPYCSSCRNLRIRAKDEESRGGSKRRVMGSVGRVKSPRTPAASRATSRRYYEANRESINTRRREVYAQDVARGVRKTQQWRKANPYYEAWRGWKRLAKIWGLAGECSYQQLLDRFKRFDYRCQGCNRKSKKLQQDHKIPASKGGAAWPSNLQPLCTSCSAGKSGQFLY